MQASRVEPAVRPSRPGPGPVAAPRACAPAPAVAPGTAPTTPPAGPPAVAGVIRLLLVDDRPATLRGLRMWLSLQPDLQVVGEAPGDPDPVGIGRIAGEVGADVVLMDVEMTRGCCLAATTAVCSGPRLPVVLLCLVDDARTRERARLAGAAAVVAKHELGRLLHTIREVAA